jgi:hypothetical protein
VKGKWLVEGQLNSRQSRACQIHRIKNQQLGGVVLELIEKAEQKAITFKTVRMARNEYRLLA